MLKFDPKYLAPVLCYILFKCQLPTKWIPGFDPYLKYIYKKKIKCYFFMQNKIFKQKQTDITLMRILWKRICLQKKTI